MKASTKEIIKKHNIKLVKSLGQNFLNDEGVVQRIVDAAEVGPEDMVLEVGPGSGAMTQELAARAGKVVAVEIDRNLMQVLKENLSGFQNVEVINKDIMKVDIGEIVSRSMEGTGLKYVKVVANLPYYITTPIVMKFLEQNPGINKMVFMVQKEVAERMNAKPGGKDYGALSVAVQFYSRPHIAFNVPPHCFIPQPEVDSTVISLDIYDTLPVSPLDKGMFFKVVKASFGQRRKTLLNALANSGYFNRSKEEIKKLLTQNGIGENQRGETLSITQFAELANAFYSNKKV